MKQLVVMAALLCSLFSPWTAVACDSLDGLEWMLGDWEARGDSSVATESWKRVSESTFEGQGSVFSLPDFSRRSFESLRLVSMTGKVYFTAKVAHNDYPVSFQLTSCEAKTAVFENPDHDFPTRIAYELVKPGLLRADVRGPDGKGFVLEFREKPASDTQ